MYRGRESCCVKIYETTNELNPKFMNTLSEVKETKILEREQQKLNLETPEWNQVTFGAKGVKVHGPKI